ncbi:MULTISPECIES: TM2 domain-containing protein [unclassified Minwuia]|jgi:TM2 domain-containing membrane protein YozV|uniref:TM2 domain-containing protein n=1 Tax=unclassified Minwuia TaxID=2618799 RepID=UPI00247A269A|nr:MULTISPECIES: TM2 domain-containing protein [unclassified Minwuia]
MPQTDAEFPGGSDTASARYQANARSTLLAYLLWFFLGWLGVHRFYLGRVFSGIIMLLLWGAGTGLAVVFIGYLLLIPWAIWWCLDALLIPGMVRAENNAVVDRIERGR